MMARVPAELLRPQVPFLAGAAWVPRGKLTCLRHARDRELLGVLFAAASSDGSLNEAHIGRGRSLAAFLNGSAGVRYAYAMSASRPLARVSRPRFAKTCSE